MIAWNGDQLNNTVRQVCAKITPPTNTLFGFDRSEHILRDVNNDAWNETDSALGNTTYQQWQNSSLLSRHHLMNETDRQTAYLEKRQPNKYHRIDYTMIFNANVHCYAKRLNERKSTTSKITINDSRQTISMKHLSNDYQMFALMFCWDIGAWRGSAASKKITGSIHCCSIRHYIT